MAYYSILYHTIPYYSIIRETAALTLHQLAVPVHVEISNGPLSSIVLLAAASSPITIGPTAVIYRTIIL